MTDEIKRMIAEDKLTGGGTLIAQNLIYADQESVVFNACPFNLAWLSGRSPIGGLASDLLLSSPWSGFAESVFRQSNGRTG